MTFEGSEKKMLEPLDTTQCDGIETHADGNRMGSSARNERKSYVLVAVILFIQSSLTCWCRARSKHSVAMHLSWAILIFRPRKTTTSQTSSLCSNSSESEKSLSSMWPYGSLKNDPLPLSQIRSRYHPCINQRLKRNSISYYLD